MPKFHRAIFAIKDLLTGDLVGQMPLHVFKHPAAAVRMFNDVALTQDSYIGKHLTDYDLICLGYLNDNNDLIQEQFLVLAGAALKATLFPDRKDDDQQNLKLDTK